MAASDEFRGRARATWAAGDWDSCARLIAQAGELVIERAGIEPGVELLDVGTGSGGNIAIPAALRGAKVVGLDVTPELLELARGHAAEAGVEVAWIEGDAQALPFADASFDRVVSTFGAMFAPDHARRGRRARARLPAGRAGPHDDVGQRRLHRRAVHAHRRVHAAAAPRRAAAAAVGRGAARAGDVRRRRRVAAIARERVAPEFASVEEVVQEYAGTSGRS